MSRLRNAFRRATGAATIFIASLAISGAASAGQVDVALVADAVPLPICSILEVDLVTTTSGGTAQAFDAVDAILSWDPAVLELIGVDPSSVGPEFFLWGFLNDPDGINDVTTDGDAIFTALAVPGQTVLAPAAPATLRVATVRFRVLTASASTDVALVDAMGTFGHTRVLLAGATITGALGAPVSSGTGSVVGDLDGDGQVGFTDLLIVLSSWGPCPDCCAADVNGDGTVGFEDLLIVLSAWG